MIPPSSPQRIPWNRGISGGRQQEISRLIGRGLRAAIDMKRLGERQIMLDCTVIQADGGTRTAGVTGAYVALALAIHDLLAVGQAQAQPADRRRLRPSVSGWCDGEALLDLAYVEDSIADADVNVIQTLSGDLVEVQGTAEGAAFPREQLDHLLDMASVGNGQLFAAQQTALAQVLSPADDRRADRPRPTADAHRRRLSADRDRGGSRRASRPTPRPSSSSATQHLMAYDHVARRRYREPSQLGRPLQRAQHVPRGHGAVRLPGRRRAWARARHGGHHPAAAADGAGRQASRRDGHSDRRQTALRRWDRLERRRVRGAGHELRQSRLAASKSRSSSCAACGPSPC